ISPDGTTIAFCHAGDIYVVPVEGGRARPLTIHEAYESAPVWSNDGTKIAFASDRAGNDDVYVMPASGGPATRLTFHSAGDTPTDFTPEDDAVIFVSSRMDDVDSALFPSGVLSELYEIPLVGGTPVMRSTTPMLEARFDDDGSRLVYEDRKGFEDELRKHHVSSIARDVWILDLETGTHTRRTEFAGEDRDPHLVGDTIWFLSERSGDFNVHRMNARPGAPVTQVTSFEHHPVRDLSVARDGTLAFSWHGDIHTMRPGQQPVRLDVDVSIDGRRSDAIVRTMRGGATEFDVSPDGKEVAFVVRGEVFVTSVDYDTTRRVTDTPEQERSVSFAPDGRRLLYAGERGGSWNVYEASLGEDELNFFSATVIEEKPILDSDAEEFQPIYDPEGERVAYLHDRHEVRVLDLDSGETVTVLPGDTFYSYSDGDHRFEFSPDGEWITAHFYDRRRLFFPEVALVRADGSEPPIDLSNSGYSDAAPRFAMGGEAIIWASNRYGERSHGSFGSEDDVVGTFLTRDAWDRFRLSKEDLDLRTQREEKAKEDESKKDDDGDADEAAPDDDAPDAAAEDADENADDEDADDTPDVE
ncbi:MAG: PD40 domain-containing protein, partial [Phycisphaerales bacterium]|nr:PD40 domain-containing protein [Phycisphaerales bacterium]